MPGHRQQAATISELAVNIAADFVRTLPIPTIRQLIGLTGLSGGDIIDEYIADYVELSLPSEDVRVRYDVLRQVEHYQKHHTWSTALQTASDEDEPDHITVSSTDEDEQMLDAEVSDSAIEDDSHTQSLHLGLRNHSMKTDPYEDWNDIDELEEDAQAAHLPYNLNQLHCGLAISTIDEIDMSQVEPVDYGLPSPEPTPSRPTTQWFARSPSVSPVGDQYHPPRCQTLSPTPEYTQGGLGCCDFQMMNDHFDGPELQFSSSHEPFGNQRGIVGAVTGMAEPVLADCPPEIRRGEIPTGKAYDTEVDHQLNKEMSNSTESGPDFSPHEIPSDTSQAAPHTPGPSADLLGSRDRRQGPATSQNFDYMVGMPDHSLHSRVEPTPYQPIRRHVASRSRSPSLSSELQDLLDQEIANSAENSRNYVPALPSPEPDETTWTCCGGGDAGRETAAQASCATRIVEHTVTASVSCTTTQVEHTTGAMPSDPDTEAPTAIPATAFSASASASIHQTLASSSHPRFTDPDSDTEIHAPLITPTHYRELIAAVNGCNNHNNSVRIAVAAVTAWLQEAVPKMDAQTAVIKDVEAQNAGLKAHNVRLEMRMDAMEAKMVSLLRSSARARR